QHRAALSQCERISLFVPFDIDRQLAVPVLVNAGRRGVDALAKADALDRVVIVEVLGVFDRILASSRPCRSSLKNIFRGALGQGRRREAGQAERQCNKRGLVHCDYLSFSLSLSEPEPRMSL